MKTNCLLTVVGAALLASSFAAPLRGENARFRERVAAWQSPPASRPAATQDVRTASWEVESAATAAETGANSRFVAQSVDQWTDGGEFADGLDPACCPDRCGRCMDWSWCGNGCGPRLWWVRSEGLFLWAKERNLPALVTTSDTPVPPPGTTVLLGDGTQTSKARTGIRMDFGTWLQCDELVGIGVRLWGLADDQTTFALSSTDLTNQTIERPFVQTDGTPNSLVVADPFTGFDGNIRVTSSSEIFGADAYARIRCYQSCRSRTDFVTGYQFGRINESLQIHSQTQGNNLIVDDNYTTRNEFHGGVIGVMHDTRFGCGNLVLVARVGLGNMHQSAIATGSTNGQQGGLYVENNTTVVRDEFCAAPEFGATFGYQLSSCMQVKVGYTLLYWSNVIRPESLIDDVRGDNISLNLGNSSFWVQGVTAGLTYSF